MAREKAPLPNAGPADDKKRAIDTAMAQIERMYGKGSIMRFGDKAELNVDYIPTGSLSLDVALGIGGLPKGRIVEIYGPESSGKTTLALHVIAEAQKRGGEVAFVDAEHALDPTYARALGVKVEDMLIAQPDTGEQALEITEALVRSGAIDVVVVDSVAALVPRAEIEGEMGDSYVGLQARLMSQALRKLTGAIGKTNCIVIFINQLREKVGIMYGEGISHFGELIDLGVKLELVQKSGSWFSIGETRIGQGRDAAKRYLQENPEVADKLEADIRKNFDRLMSNQARIAAKAAGRAVDVSADDFDDAD